MTGDSLTDRECKLLDLVTPIASRERVRQTVERILADRTAVATATSGGVGTGAGEGATGQDTGTAWVTRSEDCPEAPAQALLPAVDPLNRIGRRLCDGCNVREPFEHRCHGFDVCPCVECHEMDATCARDPDEPYRALVGTLAGELVYWLDPAIDHDIPGLAVVLADAASEMFRVTLSDLVDQIEGQESCASAAGRCYLDHDGCAVHESLQIARRARDHFSARGHTCGDPGCDE